MITVLVVALVSLGGFLVTAVSYILGAFKIITNFPATVRILTEFFSSFFA